jgi:hypothetical protein
MNALKKVKTKYANFGSSNLCTVHLLYTVWDFFKICILNKQVGIASLITGTVAAG